MHAKPLATISVANQLGEGVLWDAAAQAFVWTDILAAKLYRLSWGETDPVIIDLPERLGSFALTAERNIILAAFASGIARFDIGSGACKWLARPELPPGVRFNDGRTDRQGRFAAGTMVEDAERAGGTDHGVLYRLEGDGSLSLQRRGIHISNSLCWSPDGRTMYHSDGPAQTIMACAYTDAGAGAERLLARFDDGFPDGATVDAAGRIWVALWGAGCIAVLDPTGARLMTVPVAASQSSCCAFGGPDLNILAVTSARADLSGDALAQQPAAGALFLFETDVTGLPEQIAADAFP